MQFRTSIIIIITTLVVWACGTKPGHLPVDASVDAYESDCGFPGDVGNELGIGKFCAGQSDCSGTVGAPLCSSLGDPKTHFCTKTCPMGSTNACGTGDNTCTCDTGNPPRCGCTPTVCLGP